MKFKNAFAQMFPHTPHKTIPAPDSSNRKLWLVNIFFFFLVFVICLLSQENFKDFYLFFKYLLEMFKFVLL